MERDGRLHSLRSRSPTHPPYHPSAITVASDALNARGVTMGPYMGPITARSFLYAGGEGRRVPYYHSSGV